MGVQNFMTMFRDSCIARQGPLNDCKSAPLQNQNAWRLPDLQAFNNALIESISTQCRKVFHFFLPKRSSDLKFNTYVLSYVYPRESGVKNATACSAF